MSILYIYNIIYKNSLKFTFFEFSYVKGVKKITNLKNSYYHE
jgi:hypothetical protein